MVHLNLAAAKLQTEDFDEVFVQTRQALEIDENSVKALYRTGIAHLALHDFQNANIWLRRALEVDPNNVATKRALHKLAAEKNDTRRGTRRCRSDPRKRRLRCHRSR